MTVDNPSKQNGSKELKALMLVFVFLIVFIMSSRSPVDADMWWHLRAGEETIAAGKPLIVDTMTFTRIGEKWVNHSWLAQVVLFISNDLFNNIGLTLFVSVIISITMVILYVSLEGGIFLRTAIIILVVAVLARILAPRPQMFSLLLFCGLCAWVYRYLNRKTNKVWALPLVFILWSNLHGGYSFGFMLLGITLFGMVFDRIIRPNLETTMTWREIGRLSDWTAISLLAALINPNWLDTWRIPFQTVGVEVTKYIQEWESIDFHQIASLPYLVLLFGILICIGLSEKKATGIELFGITLFGALSLSAQRLIGIFSIFAAFVFARHLDSVFSVFGQNLRLSRIGRRLIGWQAKQRKRNISSGVRKVINYSLIITLAFVGWIKVLYVAHPSVVEKNIRSYYPVDAVTFLREAGQPGNLLSDYGWGGYLDWNLRENKVFLDGRADLYSDDLFFEWRDLIAAEPGWQKTLTDYGVRYILLPPDMELTRQAPQTGWEILYQDELSVLLGAKPEQ